MQSVISLLSPQDMTAVLAHGAVRETTKAEPTSFLPEGAEIGAVILSGSAVKHLNAWLQKHRLY